MATIARTRQQEPTIYASGGAIGGLMPASARRVKGLIGGAPYKGTITPIETRAHINYFMSEVRRGTKMMAELPTPATRLSVRTIVSDSAMDAFRREVVSYGSNIEAQVRLDNGLNMVYIGFNADGREITSVSRSELVQHVRALNTISDNPLALNKDLEILQRGREGYRFVIYDNTNHQDNLALASTTRGNVDRSSAVRLLMNTFGYSKREANETLLSPTNIVGLLYRDWSPERGVTDVVGMIIGERVDIRLSTGGTIRTIEMTDATIEREHRGHRRYLWMGSEFIQHVARNYTGDQAVDLLYGESNLGTTMPQRKVEQGFGIAGVLEQHAKIDGNLKNLAVTYLTNGRIEETASSLREAIENTRRE